MESEEKFFELVISDVDVMAMSLSVRRKVAAVSRIRKQICEVVWVMNLVTGQRITAPAWKENTYICIIDNLSVELDWW